MRFQAFFAVALGTVAMTTTMLFATVATAEQPSTRPAKLSVSVLPFESLSPNAPDDAAVVGAINKSLLHDLSRARQFDVTDAKRDNAEFRVSGTVQQSDGRVRVTGEVFDVRRDAQAGRFKVTGTTRELFEIEDLVADQVRSRLDRAIGDQTERAKSPREIGPSDPLLLDSRRGYRPDWMYPGDVWAGDSAAITQRYNDGLDTYSYWDSPYTLGYYGGNYTGVFAPYYRLYRPYRPIYSYGGYADYTFRGLPDRNFYQRDGFGPRSLRSFSGPVPQRWLRQR